MDRRPPGQLVALRHDFDDHPVGVFRLADLHAIPDCHQVDMAAACRIVGPQTALWGNLDPVGLLARGSVEQVVAATDALLQTVEACGHRRFVLSSGCTLAVDTPPENLAAMLDRARRHQPRQQHFQPSEEHQKP